MPQEVGLFRALGTLGQGSLTEGQAKQRKERVTGEEYLER